MNSCLLSDLIDKAIVDLISDKVINLINDRQIGHQKLSQNVSTLQPKTITVVFTGRAANRYQIILEQLALLPTNYSLNLLFSHSAYQHVSSKNLSLFPTWTNINIVDTSQKVDDKFMECDVLLFPELSLNSLAKSITNIADNLASELVQQALINHKNIVVTFDYFYEKQNLSANYQNIIQKQIDKLVSFDVQVIKISGLAATLGAQQNTHFYRSNVLNSKSDRNTANHFYLIPSTKRQVVISLADIRRHDSKQPLYLSDGSLITPLAMDMIKQKKIQIIRE